MTQYPLICVEPEEYRELDGERVLVVIHHRGRGKTSGLEVGQMQTKNAALFHVRDGYGIKQLDKAGVEVAVISGRRSKMVDVRCRELGVEHVYQGVENKIVAFEQLCSRLKVQDSACACIGDDMPDVPLMRKVALAFAVADAHPEARRAAHIVTTLPGGHGAVREVCDYLLAGHKAKTR